jgi:hypothetical protein
VIGWVLRVIVAGLVFWLIRSARAQQLIDERNDYGGDW